MTAAEQLHERGREHGLELAAINLLKEGSDPRFVAKITNIELAVVIKLKAQLEEE